jgi:hypothetical protein
LFLLTGCILNCFLHSWSIIVQKEIDQMKKIIFLASVLSMLLVGNFANAQSRDYKGGKEKAYKQGGKHKMDMAQRGGNGNGNAYAYGRKHGHKMNMNQRQRHQRMRIQDGVRNGSLTRNEARHLRKQQFQVNNYKRMAKADGKITKRERKMIARAQYRANRDIAYMKHNNRARFRR